MLPDQRAKQEGGCQFFLLTPSLPLSALTAESSGKPTGKGDAEFQTSLLKHQFKGKIKNFKMATKTKQSAPLRTGPCVAA